MNNPSVGIALTVHLALLSSLTGADPSCGSLAEGPVRRAGKHKTLYVIIRKITLAGAGAIPLRGRSE
jgi:hypothetical protein